jgi:glycosyltransferase involved in cell wall biosynthesis
MKPARFRDGPSGARATIAGFCRAGRLRQVLPMTPAHPISVVIPCYNGVSTLARALESCRLQPEAAQIIVVDDASTDSSADLVLRYARADSRVALLRMPCNGGAAQARNWGALHASHDLLAFLDADDEYLPGALAAANAFLAQNPKQVSVRLDVEYVGFPREITGHQDFAQHAATLSNTVPSSLIVRRAAFAALGGFPMDDAFRRIGGEDGAFSWALREIFGNPRLADAKRVRMHYHPGIHAERYFRIAFGWLKPDPADVADAFRFSRQFLDSARAGIVQLHGAQMTAEAGAHAAGGAAAV